MTSGYGSREHREHEDQRAYPLLHHFRVNLAAFISYPRPCPVGQGFNFTYPGGLLCTRSCTTPCWQQVKEARRQRGEDDAREHRRRSMDRRFAAYSEFLTRTRSLRNAAEAHYLQLGHGPSLAEMESLQQSANDASALVFLVLESEQTYQACRHVLRALGQARWIIHETEPDAAGDPWADLNGLPVTRPS